MSFSLTALFLFTAAAAASLLARARGKSASLVGPLGAAIGSGLLLVAAGDVLVRGQAWSVTWAWQVPLGSFALGMDPLSAIFAAVLAVVGGLAAVYGSGYLGMGEKSPQDARKVAAAWCFYNLLMAAMLVVVTARNGVLFLMAWEGMSLASFFLVMFDSQRQSVRRAAWTYLVASHLGTAFLFGMFALLAQHSPSMDFDLLSVPAELASVVFVAALIGFGTKAGFMPLHVWLPEAHPAAPSHASALMSGAMIKLGVYGLLRIVAILIASAGPPPAWWGWLLLGVGIVSGILGVLFALAQHDLKRLLAYSSVENVGIVAMGLGVGLLGISYGQPTVAALGLAGGLLHIVNHAAMKSLLFLGAGAVVHATGSRHIERLGGLLKGMRTSGSVFLVASAAIVGLPPLAGFTSEILIYLAAFSALAAGVQGATDSAAPIAGAVVAGTLALIGGLAAACFAKAGGMVFLGEPRIKAAEHAHEADRSMRWPMLVLAALTVVLGLGGWLMIQLVAPAVKILAPANTATAIDQGLATGTTALIWVAGGGAAVWCLVGVLLLVRRRLLAGREVRTAGTWDCGYAAPTPRMQYTASSFAEPALRFFRMFLPRRIFVEAPQALFPVAAEYHSAAPDLFRQRVFGPLFAAVRWLALRAHVLQQGRIQLYVLYIAVVLLVLLIWKLG